MSRNQEAREPTLEESAQALRNCVMTAHVLRAGFSMASFCTAVARAAPDPVRRGRGSNNERKPTQGKPEAHRLLSEFVS